MTSTESTLPNKPSEGPNRKRVLILIAVTVVLVFGLLGLGVARYAMFRFESRDMRQQGLDLFDAGQFDEAATVLTDYRLRRPKDHAVQLWIGRALLAQQPATRDRALEALAALDGFLTESPDDRLAKLYRLQALLQAQVPDQAYTYARDLHNTMPTQLLPLAVTLQGLSERGEHAEVIRVAERALATPLPRPGFQRTAHEALVRSHVALGQRSEAARWAREALTYQPGDPRAFRLWLEVTPADASPEGWVSYADGLEAGSDADQQVIKLLALHAAAERSDRQQRPSQAAAYAAEFDAVWSHFNASASLTAEQASTLGDLFQARGEPDRRRELFSRQAGRSDATDAHRLLWARQAFFDGNDAAMLEAAGAIAEGARPDWLLAYAVYAAQRSGDAAATATWRDRLNQLPEAVASRWTPVIDPGPPPAGWLGSAREAWPTLNDPLVLARMAEGFRAHGHPAAAAGALERALRSAPTWHDLRLAQAEAMLVLDRPFPARAAMDQYRAQNPNSSAGEELGHRIDAARWLWLSEADRQAIAGPLSQGDRPDSVGGLALGLRAGLDLVPRDPAGWTAALRGLSASSPSSDEWSAVIDAIPTRGPVRDAASAALRQMDNVSPGLAVAWTLSEHRLDRTASALAWFVDALDGQGVDAAVARLVVAEATDAPDTLGIAREVVRRFGPAGVAAGIRGWPSWWTGSVALRAAMLEATADMAGLRFVTGLDIDAAAEALMLAADFAASEAPFRQLLSHVQSAAGHAPDAALDRLGRYLLVRGDYRSAAALLANWQSHQPQDARRAASLARLLRLAGDGEAADRLVAALLDQAGRTAADASARSLIASAQALLDLRQPGAARSMYEAWLSGHPLSADPTQADIVPAAADRATASLGLAAIGNDLAAVNDAALRLFASDRAGDRALALSTLGQTQVQTATLDEFASALANLPIDRANADYWRFELLRLGDANRALAVLADESFAGSGIAELSDPRPWQWALASAAERGDVGLFERVAANASRSARGAGWFASLTQEAMRPGLTSLGDMPPLLRAGVAYAVVQGQDVEAALQLAVRLHGASAAGDAAQVSSTENAASVTAWNPDLAVAAVQFGSSPNEVRLQRLGLILVGANVSPSFAQGILNLAVRVGDLGLANHFATLLAASGQDLSLELASLRAAAGATDTATELATYWAGQNAQRLDRAEYAAELARIFISGNRFAEARELILPRLKDGESWQLAAVLQLPALVAHPGELDVWLQQLAPEVSLDNGTAWSRMVNAAFSAAEEQGSRQAAATVRRWLQNRRLSTADTLSNELDVNHLAQLGMLAQVLGDYDGMVDYYEAALEKSPDNWMVLNNMADGLASMGIRLDEALGYAQRVAEMLPNVPNVFDTLARVHLARGDTAAAVAAARRAVDLEPAQAKWQIQLLGKLMADDQPEAAAALLDELDERVAPDAAEPLRFNITDLRRVAELREQLAQTWAARETADADPTLSEQAQARRAQERAAAEAALREQARETAELRRQREAALRAEFDAEQRAKDGEPAMTP